VRKHFFERLVVIAFLAGLNPDASASADGVPQLHDARIAGSATLDAESGLLNYDYAVANGPSSEAGIWFWSIEIGRASGTAELPLDDLSVDHGRFKKPLLENLKRFEIPIESVVPVGCEVPEGWSCAVGRPESNGKGPWVDWAIRAQGDLVDAGTEVAGFQLRSRGLPTIREAALLADYVYVVPGEKSASDEDARLARENYQKARVPAKTIGPTAPPEPFQATEFLDSIVSLRQQAEAMGWIRPGAEMQSLDIRLAELRSALSSASRGGARGIASELIQDVERLSCAGPACSDASTIRPEGHALLAINLAYLRDRLP
jgi:hypothetical protein